MSQREVISLVAGIDRQQWMDGIGILYSKPGMPKANSLRNVELYLHHHPDLEGLYWYDAFRDEIMIERPLIDSAEIGSYPRPIQDHDETALAAWLNSRGLSASIQNASSALRHVAFANPRDPFLEWADALRWDGKKRIDTWLTYYAGAPDNDYIRAVGRKFLISAMARGMRPGCKVDTMLVLEGPQGRGKSALVRELAGEHWFTDQVGDVSSKDSSQLTQGVWIMEVAEMGHFRKAEANAVKAFIVRQFDRYRPPYGRHAVRRERRCVFFGTINPDGNGYLRDPTGNRRYWPVPVIKIDVDAIRKDREHLWAEAKAALLSGEQWWLDDDEIILAESEQEARNEEDPWEPPISKWLDDIEQKLNRYFTSEDVLWKVLDIPLRDRTPAIKIRINNILQRLNCIKHQHKHGIKGRSWENTR